MVTHTRTSPPTASLLTEAWQLATDTATLSGLVIDAVQDGKGCRRAGAILNSIWAMPDREIIDPSMMVALAHAGNLVLVASVEGTDIGAATGFCGPPGSPFHSHIVGLLDGQTGRGHGLVVKLYQRAWCLQQGIGEITWTFDPLVSRNAYFNIHRLGASASRYYPDFYGELPDAVNAGQGSDRMLMRWDLTAPVGLRYAAGAADGHTALGRNEDNTPGRYTPPPERAGTALIEIPRDITELRRRSPKLALQWRQETRTAFTQLMGEGWKIADVTREGRYILQRAP
ncbi:hypothetical protein [Nesterenkonia muleiensis]|uniref:hypothetical protein n=1 Tax=Nesterenkonia muleiensis TaxID=2282648 RepID=UPI000E71B3BF|nr:hypothetical protein [Nesterenkonia muleiensis]